MASTAAQSTLTTRAAVFNGATVDFADARGRVTMVVIPSGTVTAGLVAMEASQDGTNWVTLAVVDPTFGVNQFHSNTAGAFRYWRGSIVSAITGGGNVSATLMEADR